MAILSHGALAIQAGVVNNGLKVVEYDDAGVARFAAPDAAYMIPIYSNLTAAIAAASCVWALTNTGAKNVLITGIHLHSGFRGTAAVTATQWQLCRFAGGTPTGGTSVAPVKKKSTYAASSVGDARLNQAATLTMGAITPEGSMFDIGTARQLQAGISHSLFLAEYERILIAPNEGIGVFLGVVSVIGDTLAGAIHWVEETP